MKKRENDDRLAILRADPDFRALVEALRGQSPDRLKAFHDYLDRSHDPEEETALESPQRAE